MSTKEWPLTERRQLLPSSTETWSTPRRCFQSLEPGGPHLSLLPRWKQVTMKLSWTFRVLPLAWPLLDPCSQCCFVTACSSAERSLPAPTNWIIFNFFTTWISFCDHTLVEPAKEPSRFCLNMVNHHIHYCLLKFKHLIYQGRTRPVWSIRTFCSNGSDLYYASQYWNHIDDSLIWWLLNSGTMTSATMKLNFF